MIVVSRCVGQTLVIDTNINITIHSNHGDIVRIAIDAPKDTVNPTATNSQNEKGFGTQGPDRVDSAST